MYMLVPTGGLTEYRGQVLTLSCLLANLWKRSHRHMKMKLMTASEFAVAVLVLVLVLHLLSGHFLLSASCYHRRELELWD